MSRASTTWQLDQDPIEELSRFHAQLNETCQARLERANKRIAQLEAEVMRLRTMLKGGK